MLSEARREDIFDAVGTWCQAWAVGHASPAECDEWGMTEALGVAARRALAGLAQPPEAVLVDGPVNLLRHPDDPFTGEVRPVVDGDAKCASVAAASVLAKVVRDRLMRREADHYPAYDFERNKGYPLRPTRPRCAGTGRRRSTAAAGPSSGACPGAGSPGARPAQTTWVTSAKWQATG